MTAPQPGSEERLQEASLMIGLLEYERAEELLRGILRDAGEAGDDASASLALEALGIVATRRGREAHARDLLEQAVERGGNPHPSERGQLYWELARVHSGLGDAERAVEILEAALARLDYDEDMPVRVTLAVALSYAFSDNGDYGSANAVLADLVQRGAEDLDERSRGRITYALARLCVATGRTAMGLTYAERTVALYRATGDDYAIFDSLLVYALLLMDESQTEAAGDALREARTLIGSKPSATDLSFLLVEEARYHLQLGLHEDAVTRAREAIELLGDLSIPGELGDAYLVLARAYDEMGQTERAERAYTAAIDSLRRQNGWLRELAKAYRWYGKFLRRSGRPEAAMDALEQASDLSLRWRQRVDV